LAGWVRSGREKKRCYGARVPVNSTHPDYDAAAAAWQRARDVLAGEDAIKAATERYLPRLEAQSDDDYRTYKARATFFNATARTLEALVGLVFRADLSLKVPEGASLLAKAMAAFVADVDLAGTPLTSYAKHVVGEVIAVGRGGTLVDWSGGGASRTGDGASARRPSSTPPSKSATGARNAWMVGRR
jgi:hypothetical protein